MFRIVLLCLWVTGFGFAHAIAQDFPTDPVTAQHIAWVGESLRQMQSLKPGTTRGDLLKVFTTEGGLSTGLHRRYVYRECPWFKVDVEFAPIGRPPRDREGRVTLVESDLDIINTISKPYVEFSIID